MAESGVSGCEISEWNALLAPAGTPPAVIERLHAEVVKILGRRTSRPSSPTWAPRR